jgi:hypothetical protein
VTTTYEIHYHPPVTKVRFSATWTHTRDHVLGDVGAKNELTSAAAEMIVVGDERTECTAKIATGWLQNVNASLALTEDQRLTAASSSSEGQAGVAATSVLGAVVFAAGIAAGLPAVSAGAPLVRDILHLMPGVTFDPDLKFAGGARSTFAAGAEKPVAPRDRIEEEYKEKHPLEYQQRKQYQHLLISLHQQVLEVMKKATHTKVSPEQRSGVLADLRWLVRLHVVADARLQQLNQHFQAWRASTLTTWTENLIDEVAFDQLPYSVDGELQAKLHRPLEAIWDRFGLMVVPFPSPPTATQASQDPKKEEGIYEREPRQVTWKLWKKPEEGVKEPVCVGSGTSLVLDNISTSRFLPFRKSIWAKRTMKATFGTGGSLSGLDVQATSSLGVAAQAVGNFPSTGTAALEQAGKFYDQVYALRSKSLDQEVGRAKKMLELKQNENAAAGLAATQADYAEQERLKQQVDIAQNISKLHPEALATPSLKAQTDLLDAQDVVGHQLQTDQDLADVRAEVERRRAE